MNLKIILILTTYFDLKYGKFTLFTNGETASKCCLKVCGLTQAGLQKFKKALVKKKNLYLK